MNASNYNILFSQLSQKMGTFAHNVWIMHPGNIFGWDECGSHHGTQGTHIDRQRHRNEEKRGRCSVKIIQMLCWQTTVWFTLFTCETITQYKDHLTSLFSDLKTVQAMFVHVSFSFFLIVCSLWDRLFLVVFYSTPWLKCSQH